MLELDDMLFMNARFRAAVKFVKDTNFAAMNGPFLMWRSTQLYILHLVAQHRPDMLMVSLTCRIYYVPCLSSLHTLAQCHFHTLEIPRVLVWIP